MSVIAKNLGNTGSTSGNRVVFEYRTAGGNFDFAVDFPVSSLLSASAHTYGQSPGYTGEIFLTKIKTVLVYGTAITLEGRVFSPGYHEFSDIGGLPLLRVLTNKATTTTTEQNSLATTGAGFGAVVEFRV